MISHITLGTNDETRAAGFYAEVLGALGYAPLPQTKGVPPAFQKADGPTVFVCLPLDGRPATWGNGTHIAFVAPTGAAVHAFHAAALRLGGQCEGPPGPRPHYADSHYAAYVRDPDGNKLQAVCTAPDPA